MNVDPTSLLQSLFGLSGVPQIQQFVQWLKYRWELPVKLSPLAAVATGVVVNVGIALLLHMPALSGFEWGLLAGFGACGWHEITK